MERSNLSVITFLRNLLFLSVLLCEVVAASSFTDSVLIGGSGPADSKAQLDVKSTTKGVLMPRMTTTQQNAITSPTEGLLIYDNVLHQLSNYNGSAWTAVGGTPSAATGSTLGTVKSTTTVSHQFLTGLTTGTGAFTQAQPAFTDISGVATAAQLPTPTVSTIGGVESFAAVTHQWINAVSTSGVHSSTQPAFSDISGSVAASQLPNPSASTLGGIESTVGASHQWISTISTSGVPGLSQPAFTDISGSVASTQMPALTGDATSTAGTVATTVGKIQGIAVASTSPTSNQVLQYNGTAWAPGTATSSGGINWITTGDAETNSTTGWIMYNDGASSSPVDCTGGTIVGTPLTVVSSSPLSGTYSYLWTHGASNAQGTGFSYAFTLDTASATRVENTQFDITVASGTWAPGSPPSSGSAGADGDQTVWIYDVDSSTLIQPTTYRIYSGTGFHFQTYWQPVASTSRNYRLCVHNATTTATAYTTKFDSFSVAPSTYTYGSPATDTTTFTPALSASTTPPTLGSGSIQQGSYRRVGDVLEVWEEVIFGSSGTNAGSGTYRLTLPNGYLVDTVKLSQTSARAYGGTASITSAGTVYDGIAVDVSGTNPGFMQLTRNNTVVTNASPGAWTANDNIKAHFTVPILGWSSGVQMSDSAPQTLIAMNALVQTPTGTISSGSFNVIKFGTVSSDSTGGAYSTSTGLFTCPVPGKYRIYGNVEITGTYTAAQGPAIKIFKNGTSGTSVSIGGYVATASVTTAQSIPFQGSVDCNTGDTLGAYALATGTSLSYTAVVSASSLFIEKLSDPRTTGATETVSARYHAATATVTSSYSKVTYSTSDFDDHGMYVSGVATLQYPGKYHINAKILANATSCTVGQFHGLGIFVNGVDYSDVFYTVSNTSAIGADLLLSDDYYGKVGDTIDIRIESNCTTPIIPASSTRNAFSIERVGN